MRAADAARVIGCVIVAMAFATGCGAVRDIPARGVGAQAPAFDAVNIDGQPVSVAKLNGRVVLLNEWATWCGPCREEIPQLEALHRTYASQGLVLVGVSEDAYGTAGDVQEFVRAHGMTYDIWLDPDKRFSIQFLAIGVPSTVLIDRAGVIRWRGIGALRQGDTTLALAIRQALKS